MHALTITWAIISASIGIAQAFWISLLIRENKTSQEGHAKWRQLTIDKAKELLDAMGEVKYYKQQLALRKREIALHEAEFARLNKFVWGEPLLPHTTKELEDYIAELHRQITELTMDTVTHVTWDRDGTRLVNGASAAIVDSLKQSPVRGAY